LNDWQTAMVALYLKNHLIDDEFYHKTKILYTIHNLQYQGMFDPSILQKLDLGWDYFVPSKLEFFWKVNFMKAGLIYADHISTVSESYCKEIMTKKYGEGLEGLLSTRKEKITGIINGLDTGEWSPRKDYHLKKKYSKKDISGKIECKKELLEECGFKDLDVPAFIMVSRLVDHKGFELIQKVLPKMLETEKMYFILIGVGDEKYHEFFTELKYKFPDKVAIFLKFDISFSRKIYAGGDIFLLPAKFEPSGIGNLISMKYGTVPVVRRISGMKDAYENCSDECKVRLEKTSFEEFNCEELTNSIKNTLELYKDKTEWAKFVNVLMEQDFSWRIASRKYEKLYKKITEKPLKGKK